ncbi:MAG: hypothetical protein AABW61_01965 [Candidatus Aenigmatarchaeota archaeon]
MNNLPAGKEQFLENLIPSVGILNDVDFDVVLKAASEFGVGLHVKYLLARGKGEEAITALEEAGEHINAAELCIELRMKDRAVNNFERAGSFGNIKRAVEVHLGIEYTIPNLYGEIKERIDGLERAEKYIDAIDLSKRYGMIMRAIENYRQGGNNQEADRLSNVSDIVKAAKVWENGGYPIEACNLLSINDLNQELAATQERAGYFVSAGSTYERLGDLDSAVRLYKQAKFDHGVERILRNQGREDELVVYWEETGNKPKLARHFEEKDPAQAAVFYTQLNDFRKASDCLVRAKKPVIAIELLVEKELYEDALKIREAIKDLDGLDQAKISRLTIKCYQELSPRYEVSNPEKALKFYSKLNDQDGVRRVAIPLMNQAAAIGDFPSAARYALMIGDNNKAQIFEGANLLLNPSPQS